jgi:hypothetical protein
MRADEPIMRRSAMESHTRASHCRHGLAAVDQSSPNPHRTPPFGPEQHDLDISIAVGSVEGDVSSSPAQA